MTRPSDDPQSEVTVEPRPGVTSPARLVGAWVLTGLAAVLVLLALTAPNRLQELDVSAFVRLPIEALAYLLVVLAIPPRFGRARVVLAVLAGLVLALSTIFKVFDMGFLEALNRPFDPLIDWRYASSLVETVRGSFSGGVGTAMLILAGAAVVALLVLLPLAMVRVTRVAARHRAPVVKVVAGLASLWLVLALVGVRSDGGMVASRDTSDYVYGQISRIPGQVRDQREFARAAEEDPLRQVPADQLLTGLKGKDVLFVFVESYGRTAVDGSTFSPGVDDVLASGTRTLDQAGFLSRSGWLTSPTFGAISWLAHSTLQSGLWVDSQQRYDVLVTSPRLTLSRIFGAAGWRTVGDVPANNRDWPQGEFYDYDQFYDSRNVGYEGPRFGYPTMPDQYTLDAFHRLELAPQPRVPVMAEIDLITSHAPWSRTPRMIPQSEVGDGSVYDGMPETLPSETDIWPSPERVQKAYGESIEYSLNALVAFLQTYGDPDLVTVFLGDHQPATIVSGVDAGHDVPITIVAKDPTVMDRVADWGWTRGLRPDTDAPVWRMDAFRDKFLAAFGSAPDPAVQPTSAH